MRLWFVICEQYSIATFFDNSSVGWREEVGCFLSHHNPHLCSGTKDNTSNREPGAQLLSLLTGMVYFANYPHTQWSVMPFALFFRQFEVVPVRVFRVKIALSFVAGTRIAPGYVTRTAKSDL